jgi:cholesterol oxidase
MGKACDFFGRVKNYEKLYVNDSALIPGSTACANPAFTVAAIAERNMEKIIHEDFG